MEALAEGATASELKEEEEEAGGVKLRIADQGILQFGHLIT